MVGWVDRVGEGGGRRGWVEKGEERGAHQKADSVIGPRLPTNPRTDR